MPDKNVQVTETLESLENLGVSRRQVCCSHVFQFITACLPQSPLYPWMMELATHKQVDYEVLSLNEPSIQSSRTSFEETTLNDGVHLATLAEKKRLWWRTAVINVVFIASWYVVCPALKMQWDPIINFRFFFAMLLSIYNKWMFSAEHFGFPAPLFVTTMHMFIQFLLAAALRHARPNSFRPVHNPTPKDYTYVFVVWEYWSLNFFLKQKRCPNSCGHWTGYWPI